MKIQGDVNTDCDDDDDEILIAEDVVPLPQPSAPLEEEVYAAATLLASEHEQGAPASATAAEPSAPLESDAMAATVTEASEEDILAQASAAQAREEGVAVIRDHVSSYLEQNPDASYVTWIATLHPENAEVSIDPRFLIPGNPWSTVFEEAKSTMNGVTPAEGEQRPGTSSTTTTTAPRQSQTAASHPQAPAGRYYGGLIPLIVGFSMILYAILVALTLQLSSTVVYFMAVICAQLCRALSSRRLNLCTGCLYAGPWFFLQMFRFLDSLLLVLDTLIVEILAALAYLICAPLAVSHAVGTFYHQQTRRLPHYVRWACRKPFYGFDPPRVWGREGGQSSSSETDAAVERGSCYRLLVSDQEGVDDDV